MFRFFRRHRWLLIVVFTITCGTFLYWGATVPSRNSRGGGSGEADYGTIYGKVITPEMYAGADHDVRLLYLFRYGQWPDRMPNVSKYEIESQTYGRLLMNQKAEQLGIHVSDADVATAADQMLRSPELAQALGFKSGNIPFGDFVRFLQASGLDSGDFQRFVHDDLVVHQLMETMGLPGTLITPQEAVGLYRREHQLISAQSVFFSLSNYLSQVAAAPDAVAQFYTNHLADYRLPDRVQVGYVAFGVTNYLAAAEQKIGVTNLDYQVENIFRQNGLAAVPGAKTPEEAKAEIRRILIKREATTEATAGAKDFATALFAMDPPKLENLAALAKQKGLTVKTTAPFGSQFGPEEFLAPAAFTRAAFEMSSDVPLAGPIPGSDALYVIALDKQLPSEIPSFDSIRDRATDDFRREKARALALEAGTNFVTSLAVQKVLGEKFSEACSASGVSAEMLQPFSLSTQELPGFDQESLSALKQAAFTTPAGHTSRFVETADGGFVIYIQSRLPVDTTEMTAAMPQFLATIRRERENEAFQVWLNTEASRELRNTTLAKEMPTK